MLVLARFIRLADQWFDLMNSYTVTHWKEAKNAFGLKLETQTTIINEFKKQVTDLHVRQRTGMIDWHRGIIQSLNALPMLLSDLKAIDAYGGCSTSLQTE